MSSRCAAAIVQKSFYSVFHGEFLSSASPQQTEVVKVKGKFGGPQPNAGRKKGGMNARTKMLRSIADNAVKKGRSPLDIMLKNMRFYDEKAESMLAVVESKLGDKKVVAAEILALLQEMSNYRMSAQKCACDAAPFAVKVDDERMKAKPEGDMTPDELSDYYNKLRLRPTSVEPLIIDNETGDPVHADDAAED
jgi:hypothetical protein